MIEFNTSERTVLVVGAALCAVAMDLVFWDWPASVFMAELWAPVLHVGLISFGAFLFVPRERTSTEIAVDEFSHMGLRPEVIASVIVENRKLAHELITMAEPMHSPTNKALVTSIANEALSIIADFAGDTSDIARSRTLLRQCLDQTRKVIISYLLIEARKGVLTKDEFVDIAVNTELGLKQIHGALVEQHRRNLDNNQATLEIDLEISDQLLKRS